MEHERRDYKENGTGRRDYDKLVCHFYNPDTRHCTEVDGVKRIIKWGVSIATTIILGVFISAFGYFAHNQEKTHDLMIEQTKNVAELKAIIEYQVLPSITKERKDREGAVDRSGNHWNKPDESRDYSVGVPGGIEW